MKIVNTLPYAQGMNLVYEETNEGGFAFVIIKWTPCKDYFLVDNSYRGFVVLSGKTQFLSGEKEELIDASTRGSFRESTSKVVSAGLGEKTGIKAISDEVLIGAWKVGKTQDNQIKKELHIGICEYVAEAGKWCCISKEKLHVKAIVYFRFFPENGFGIARVGETALLIKQNSCIEIKENCEGEFVCAPGYTGYGFLMEWE